MRQHDHAGEQAEAGSEDLGVAAALRGAVMEQDDAVRDDHGARRPGDDRQLGAAYDVGPQVEQAQAIGEDRDVTASDGERATVLEDGLDLVEVAAQGLALVRPLLALEVLLELPDLEDVVGVEQA